MTNYIEFSAKIKEKYPEYKDVDDLVLAQKIVEKYPEYKEKVTFDEVKPEKKGIDLTPSGLYKKALAGALSPARAVIQKQSIPEAYQSGMEALEKFKPAGGIGDMLFDIGVYSKIPMLKGSGFGNFVGNAALQGALPGALEGLKSDNAGGGAAGGATIAGLLQSIPYAGKILSKPAQYIGKKAIEGLTDLKPETLQQVIKPNSKALDLTEDTAQNLLMDTTERLQNDYQSLIDNAGQEIQKAAMNLPETRGVFKSSLKNALDDIFGGSQVSGNKALNPALNSDKDIYNTVSKLIDSSKNGVQFTAPEMYDLMGNIKRIPINWESTTANESNALKQMIYGDFARRLGNLSPELRKANKVYSDLAKFEKNEGIRNILLPKRKGDIDSASKALRNYNSTVTKGNTNRNIQDLEKILITNGKQSFINDIDDVNAAMDLLTQPKTGRNFLGAQTLAKGLVTPALKAVREANRAGVPEKLQTLQELIAPIAERLPMAASKGITGLLFGNNQ